MSAVFNDLLSKHWRKLAKRFSLMISNATRPSRHLEEFQSVWAEGQVKGLAFWSLTEKEIKSYTDPDFVMIRTD